MSDPDLEADIVQSDGWYRSSFGKGPEWFPADIPQSYFIYRQSGWFILYEDADHRSFKEDPPAEKVLGKFKTLAAAKVALLLVRASQ